jgi:sulfotransferase
MTEQPLHFVSGLPRSGSTLLMNLLGQNPAHHVTPTSGLIHLMRHLVQTWPDHKEFRSQGLENVKPQVLSALRGLLYGFHEQPFADDKTVFDKSRGWLHYVEPLEEILCRPVKIITMVRDVRAIVASFENIFRGRGIEYELPDRDSAELLTTEGRARYALRADQVTGRSILRLRDAMQRCPDRLLVVPYDNFTSHPIEAMQEIHAFLDLPAFDYDPNRVEQVTREDDCVNCMDLHRIRPTIEPELSQSWREILPDELAADIADGYSDINVLAAGPIVNSARVNQQRPRVPQSSSD